MPYAPDTACSAYTFQVLSCSHRSYRQGHCVDSLKPKLASIALAVAWAAVGSDGGAVVATPVPPVVMLELEVVESCASRICSGSAIVGLAASVSVLAAAVIAISVCRSCTRRATEPLCPRPSMDSKRLLAPVPWGFITLAAPQTTTTRRSASPAAGSAMPDRRNRPRFFFELRAPNVPVPAAVRERERAFPGPSAAEPTSEGRESPADACGRSA